MFYILFFTIAGFVAGLGYVMIKRKIKPGPILSVSFLSLLSTGIWKAIKVYFLKPKGKKKFF